MYIEEDPCWIPVEMLCIFYYQKIKRASISTLTESTCTYDTTLNIQ